MSTIQIETKIAAALPKGALAEHFRDSCAHCLGLAAEHLMQAVRTGTDGVAEVSLGIFEGFVADAQQAYGLARGDALAALNAAREELGFEVTPDSIEKIEAEHGVTPVLA